MGEAPSSTSRSGAQPLRLISRTRGSRTGLGELSTKGGALVGLGVCPQAQPRLRPGSRRQAGEERSHPGGAAEPAAGLRGNLRKVVTVPATTWLDLKTPASQTGGPRPPEVYVCACGAGLRCVGKECVRVCACARAGLMCADKEPPVSSDTSTRCPVQRAGATAGVTVEPRRIADLAKTHSLGSTLCQLPKHW